MWGASTHRACRDADDGTGPRRINAYFIELKNFDANGKEFKLEPQRMLYALQWLHTATPPDFHLQLVRDPQLWFDFVAAMLLGALFKHDSELRDSLRGATAV